MPTTKAVFTLSAFLAGLQVAQAGLNLDSATNIAVYWGKLSATPHASRMLIEILPQARIPMDSPLAPMSRSACLIIARVCDPAPILGSNCSLT